MESLDAILTKKRHVVETSKQTAERVMKIMGKGSCVYEEAGIINAIFGVYLTAKAITLNQLRGKTVTTRQDIVELSSAALAPLSYFQLPEEVEERTYVVLELLESAKKFRCAGEVAGIVMLTGKGLQVVNDMMKKETTYS